MSLKELISSLIAPLSARPKKGIYQKITVTGDGENHNFTMPIDGWVSLVGQNNNVGSEKTSCFLWGDAGSEAPTASGSIIAPPGYTVQGLGFFRKGQRVFYNIVGFSICEARIFALVGGGILSYFATIGGGLWLRLNHFLSRFSLYTRERLNYRLSYPTTFLKQIPSGSGISHSLKQRKLNTESRAATRLLRHLMGQRVYLWTVRQIPQLKTQEFRQEISTQRHTAQTTSVCDMPASGFRLSRVRRLGLVLMEVRQHYGAVQQSARLSICEGGAL